jgi:hypothetical protein
MGRKPKLTPHQRAEAIKRRDRGEAVREIARLAQWVLPYTLRLAQAGQSTQPCAARTVALCSHPDTSSFALEFARICASCTPREAVAMGAVTAPIQPQPR